MDEGVVNLPVGEEALLEGPVGRRLVDAIAARGRQVDRVPGRPVVDPGGGAEGLVEEGGPVGRRGLHPGHQLEAAAPHGW